MWSETRNVQAGMQADESCIRCGTGRETLKHRYWECPENCRLERSSSDHLARVAKEEGEWESLWTRGVLRRDLMENIVWEDEQKKTEVSQCIGGGDPGSTTAKEGETLHIFTDASGGKHTSNKLLRRVGWGFTIVEGRKAQKLTEPGQEGEECFNERTAWMGTLGREPHTTGRGELVAVREALSVTEGNTIIYTD